VWGFKPKNFDEKASLGYKGLLKLFDLLLIFHENNIQLLTIISLSKNKDKNNHLQLLIVYRQFYYHLTYYKYKQK
jgi:hypothetical protein